MYVLAIVILILLCVCVCFDSAHCDGFDCVVLGVAHRSRIRVSPSLFIANARRASKHHEPVWIDVHFLFCSCPSHAVVCGFRYVPLEGDNDNVRLVPPRPSSMA